MALALVLDHEDGYQTVVSRMVVTARNKIEPAVEVLLSIR